MYRKKEKLKPKLQVPGVLVPSRKEKVTMIITKCMYPMEKKTEIKYQVQNGALITDI